MQRRQLEKAVVGALSAFLLTCFAAATESQATSTIGFSGNASSVMRLSVVDYGAPHNGVSSAANLGQTAASVTFADRVRKNGSDAQGHIGLQIKSNCPYALRLSRSSWVAQNLRYKGQLVGADDGGSFIRVSSSGVTGSYGSNPAGTVVEPSLTGSGKLLSQLSSGPVTSQSTLVAYGSPACSSGGIDSSNNGLVVHFNLSCLDGDQLAPVDEYLQGFFQTTLQFQVFAQRL